MLKIWKSSSHHVIWLYVIIAESYWPKEPYSSHAHLKLQQPPLSSSLISPVAQGNPTGLTATSAWWELISSGSMSSCSGSSLADSLKLESPNSSMRTLWICWVAAWKLLIGKWVLEVPLGWLFFSQMSNRNRQMIMVDRLRFSQLKNTEIMGWETLTNFQ